MACRSEAPRCAPFFFYLSSLAFFFSCLPSYGLVLQRRCHPPLDITFASKREKKRTKKHRSKETQSAFTSAVYVNTFFFLCAWLSAFFSSKRTPCQSRRPWPSACSPGRPRLGDPATQAYAPQSRRRRPSRADSPLRWTISSYAHPTGSPPARRSTRQGW